MLHQEQDFVKDRGSEGAPEIGGQEARKKGAANTARCDGILDDVEAELGQAACVTGRSVRPLISWVVSLAVFVTFGLLPFSIIGVLCLTAVVLAHELGHFAGTLVWGYRDIRMTGISSVGTHSGARSALIALFGPVTGLVFGATLAIAYSLCPQEILLQMARGFLFFNLLNLIPLYPMDGSLVLKNSVFLRSPNIEAMFRVFAAGFVVWAFSEWAPAVSLLGVAILLSVPLSYRLARISERLRTELMEGEVLTIERPPRRYLLRTIELLLEYSPWMRMSTRFVTLCTKRVWERTRTCRPSVVGVILLLVLYASSIFFGSMSSIALRVAVQQHRDTGTSHWGMARGLSYFLCVFLAVLFLAVLSVRFLDRSRSEPDLPAKS